LKKLSRNLISKIVIGMFSSNTINVQTPAERVGYKYGYQEIPMTNLDEQPNALGTSPGKADPTSPRVPGDPANGIECSASGRKLL